MAPDIVAIGLDKRTEPVRRRDKQGRLLSEIVAARALRQPGGFIDAAMRDAGQTLLRQQRYHGVEDKGAAVSAIH